MLVQILLNKQNSQWYFNDYVNYFQNREIYGILFLQIMSLKFIELTLFGYKIHVNC